MAFRNPLTSLPAAGIIGLIGGSQLAADSINGKTIIGANFLTAADGSPRIIVGPSAHHGAAPAMTWDLDGTGVNWQEPYIESDPVTGDMTIQGKLGALSGSQVRLLATGAIILESYDVAGAVADVTLADGTIALTGTDIALTGKVRGQPYTASGSVVDTPSGGGNMLIDYGVTFQGIPWPVCSSGSGAVIASGFGTDGSQGGVTLYDAAGALITSGSRRINWSVTGILA